MHLQALEGRRFAYALAGGTVGVCEGTTLLWSQQAKHAVTCMAAFDINGDGILELAVGRSDGTVEV